MACMWVSLVTAYKIWHNLFRPATSSTQISLLTILAWLLAIHFKLNSKASRKPFNNLPKYKPFGFPVPSNIPDRIPWADVQTCKSIRKAPRPRNGKDRLRPIPPTVVGNRGPRSWRHGSAESEVELRCHEPATLAPHQAKGTLRCSCMT